MKLYFETRKQARGLKTKSQKAKSVLDNQQKENKNQLRWAVSLA